MPEQTVLLCDWQPCDERPVKRYLVSGPDATWEILLCPRHQHELTAVAARGRIVGTPRRTESEKMDGLWEST
jgi:hypothetical protein